jgi:hypothetical protein
MNAFIWLLTYLLLNTFVATPLHLQMMAEMGIVVASNEPSAGVDYSWQVGHPF